MNYFAWFQAALVSRPMRGSSGRSVGSITSAVTICARATCLAAARGRACDSFGDSSPSAMTCQSTPSSCDRAWSFRSPAGVRRLPYFLQLLAPPARQHAVRVPRAERILGSGDSVECQHRCRACTQWLAARTPAISASFVLFTDRATSVNNRY
jgi:hypothetical protein